MKPLKTTFLMLLIAFITINIQAQKAVNETPKHSHPEYEESLQNIKDNQMKAEETYQQAKETYALSKEVFENKKSIEDKAHDYLGFFITILFLVGAGSQASNWFTNRKLVSDNKIANDKILKDANEKLLELKEEQLLIQSKEIKKIIDANEETIIKMIASKEKDYFLRKNAKILIVYDKNTIPTIGFKKVLNLFDCYYNESDSIILTKLSSILTQSNINILKKAELIIFENNDIKGKWNIQLSQNPSTEEINEVNANKKIMVDLANKICDKTSLIYYGQGVFPIENIEPEYQHMIAYANSPSTLYSNIMNMLKFQDVLKREE